MIYQCSEIKFSLIEIKCIKLDFNVTTIIFTCIMFPEKETLSWTKTVEPDNYCLAVSRYGPVIDILVSVYMLTDTGLYENFCFTHYDA